MIRVFLEVRGIVQGVGFRPFVYRLAKGFNLTGFVRNTSNGVEIEIQGKKKKILEFINKLKEKGPQASIIEEITSKRMGLKKDENDFVIKESRASKGFTQISPDIATCKDCLREFFTPHNRRYKFPFINCTNCGPRYSIIYNTPYDRKQTSMKEFLMCPDCKKEFEDISDRRFHAQPDCCYLCGPELSLYRIAGKKIKIIDPILKTVELLKKGKIIAIKGIGGFHIACDATDSKAVRKLRRLKNRPTKPFAIMTKKENLNRIVYLNKNEKKILNSPVAPILLLRKKGKIICKEVAPKNPYLGVMLPYTPLHYLLLEKIPYLVMTSANIADEPLVKDEPQVKKKLKNFVSYFLTHNREIINRCDDSVGFYLKNHGLMIIRRSRGFVPLPIDLPYSVKPTLAVGPYLKNSFALAHKKEAYLAPHIGDLDNLETLDFFKEMVEKYKRWFKIEPELIAHDLHPDYLSTKIAQEIARQEKLPLYGVQHHIAHIASCLGENKISDKVIGIAFDGTGYGLDGKIWGGEFFVGDIKDLKRVAHLEYLPLPGGEESIRRPYRVAIAYLVKLLGKTILNEEIEIWKKYQSEGDVIIKMIETNYNLADTSSMGRLFDCVSALLGITEEITYEAEAAINLEYTAKRGIKDYYPYELSEDLKGAASESITIKVSKVLEGIISDTKKKLDKGIISAKFHNTIVRFSLDIAKKMRRIYDVNKVVLSGGVFQNRYLLNLMIEEFTNSNFKVYNHKKLPPNDGCISYGQVLCSYWLSRNFI